MSGPGVLATAAFGSRALARSVRVPATIIAIVAMLLSFFPLLGLLAFAIGSVALLTWFANTIVRMGQAIWRGSWAQCILRAVALVSLWPIALAASWSADYVHLFTLYPMYAVQVAANADHRVRPVYFRWGGIGSSERSLAYDTTGQLAREVALGSRPWPDEPVVTTSARHLIGDFYVVTMSW